MQDAIQIVESEAFEVFWSKAYSAFQTKYPQRHDLPHIQHANINYHLAVEEFKSLLTQTILSSVNNIAEEPNEKINLELFSE